ncbi:hypothetical protein, partial [Leptospira santarosai]|uniref:hypothetical protein n=1 Tax=Leptospira santarosai TaxID=28183 RepID=UPI001C3FFAFA
SHYSNKEQNKEALKSRSFIRLYKMINPKSLLGHIKTIPKTNGGICLMWKYLRIELKTKRV